MENNNFCLFIITHGRPDKVITLATLQKLGSKIPTYIIIDNEDDKAKDYFEKFPGKVIQFDKIAYAKNVDSFDNLGLRRSTIYARNACFDIAENLGFKYFCVLDDDYTSFTYRINSKLEHPDTCPTLRKDIDEVFFITLKYFIKSDFTSICFSQGGDWFGGGSSFNKKPVRKAMNSWFCSTDRRFNFFSRLNEDVNTYMVHGHRGLTFLTIPHIQLNQVTTQKSDGGMSQAYLNNGTYVKSFYTILCRPDCCKISMMGSSNRRMHHRIDWLVAVPCIIDPEYKK